MREKFVMKPYVWYSRTSSKKFIQHGVVTDHPDLHFSVYFAPTPWGDKKDDIGFAHFEDDPSSYISRINDFEPSDMDSYLWFKVSHATKIAHQSIAKIFGDDFVRIK
jgi:hypothetical protein